jgi:hypothetical protein
LNATQVEHLITRAAPAAAKAAVGGATPAINRAIDGTRGVIWMRCAWLLLVLALPTTGYAEVCPDRSSPEL